MSPGKDWRLECGITRGVTWDEKVKIAQVRTKLKIHSCATGLYGLGGVHTDHVS